MSEPTLSSDDSQWQGWPAPSWRGPVEFHELLFGCWPTYVFLVVYWENVLRVNSLPEWRYMLLHLCGAAAFLINHYFQRSPFYKGPLGLINVYTYAFVIVWYWLLVLPVSSSSTNDPGKEGVSKGWQVAAVASFLPYMFAFIGFELLARLGVNKYGISEFWFVLATYGGFAGIILWRGRTRKSGELNVVHAAVETIRKNSQDRKKRHQQLVDSHERLAESHERLVESIERNDRTDDEDRTVMMQLVDADERLVESNERNDRTDDGDRTVMMQLVDAEVHRSYNLARVPTPVPVPGIDTPGSSHKAVSRTRTWTPNVAASRALFGPSSATSSTNLSTVDGSTADNQAVPGKMRAMPSGAEAGKTKMPATEDEE